MNKRERDLLIAEGLLEGKTMRELGDEFGITVQRVSMIRKRLLPSVPTKDLGAGRLRQKCAASRLAQAVELQAKAWVNGRTTWRLQDQTSRDRTRILRRKRQNNRHQGRWEWAIEPGDIVWPKVCPVLGIDLDYRGGSRTEHSASFDRYDSSKGYVPGNVFIISYRANRIKNNGTAEEHEQIARWMREVDKTLVKC